MPSLYRIAAVVAGTSGTLSALMLYHSDKFKAYASSDGSENQDYSVVVKQGKRRHRSSWNSNWDKMAQKTKEDKGGETPRSTATRHLILIRHGQYEHWHSDQDKKVLTELGRQQAIATGQRLKELGETYDMLYYSTMTRATETAQLISQILPDVPTKSCDLMREGAPIRPEPSSSHWKPEEYEFFRDSARIEAAFRKYFHRALPTQTENTTEILVCHANVIRYFVCRALQLPPEAWLRISLGNASITRLTIRPNGRVSLRTLGNTGHFPPRLFSYM